MVKKIVVNQTPPGQAPQEIRDAWIGCEIPLATESDLAVDRPSDVRDGNQNEGGYRVLRMSAIVALRENGKQWQLIIGIVCR